jgi:hypothetical protein
MTTTPYKILGVPQSAGEETIKAAFHRAAKAYHPDLNAGDPAAEQKLRLALAAYDILKSPERRAAYDLQVRAHRRAMGRRVAASGGVGLASGGVVALAVWLSVSLSHQHVASTPAVPPASLAMEWERVEASGDPKAIWAFVVRNPDAPQSALARSRLMEMIDSVEDVPLLNVLRLVASHAVADRARERLVQLGALTTQEAPPLHSDGLASRPTEVARHEAVQEPVRQEPVRQEPMRQEPVQQEPVQQVAGVTPTVAVREQPAVQVPQEVPSKVAAREEPVLQQPEEDATQNAIQDGTHDATRALGREEPARKPTRMQDTPVKRLAKGRDPSHDPVRPVTAENRSPALFGVGF